MPLIMFENLTIRCRGTLTAVMVEIKETQEVVIAKPVAIRPSLSNLKSLSELISDGGASPPPPAPPTVTTAGAAVTIIRPRTVRFKPVSGIHLAAGDEACQPPSWKAPQADIARNVVYKPVARLVSKKTASLLANLGSGCGIMLTEEIADFGTPIRSSDEDNHRTNLPSNSHQSFPTQPEQKAHNMQGNSAEAKMVILPPIRQRASYDGHSWRKYGQKQVKGSEYPRSYYKCTHPSCPMKKKVEKTLDGQIAEIVYSGEHNHPKPHPFSHMLPDPNVQNPTMQDEARNLAQVSQQDDRIEGCEHTSEDRRTTGFCVHLPATTATLLVNDPGAAAAGNASVSTSNDSPGQSGECVEATKSLEVKGDDFRRKRTKHENSVLEASADCDVIGDGFRWRKYGQKVVKGNPYPRSYYRCTSPKCQARKYVERTSEDPGSFITTYEGRHNHDLPVKSTDSEASKKSSKKRS